MFIALLAIGVIALSACVPIAQPAETNSAVQTEEGTSPESVIINRESDVPRITVDDAKVHFDNGDMI